MNVSSILFKLLYLLILYFRQHYCLNQLKGSTNKSHPEAAEKATITPWRECTNTHHCHGEITVRV